jgi:hypothetical protein
MSSILTDIKKSLGIEADYSHFDPDIIMHSNSVLLTLNQIGIGPTEGLIITGDTEVWTDLLGDRKDLEAVKTLIYMKVKLIFDPPTSSFVIEAMNRTIQELEWRLNLQAEPKPVIDVVVDGGVV